MIEMSATIISGQPAVTVLKLNGELDSAFAKDVREMVGELYQSGTRNLLLDMSELTFMDSSGLVALHAILRQMRGEETDPSDQGWGSIMDGSGTDADPRPKEAHLKLYDPQPEPQKALEMSGLVSLLEIYTDWDQAVNSFARSP